MWLKLLLGGLVILFCTFLGYFAAGKYRARRDFFSQLSAFNEKYLAELKYARKPLGEFLREFDAKGDFEKTLQAFSSDRACEVKLSFLTAEEREETTRYLRALGRGDSHAQSGFFEAQTGTLSQKKAEAEREAKSRGDLYLKLGLLSGLAFVILIV